MSKSISVPVLPNKPLLSANEVQSFGEILLRKNTELDFTENMLFDESIIKYDENYQNSVAHSSVFQTHIKEVGTLIKSLAPRHSRLVEVGCGKGHFLDYLGQDDYFQISGYDTAYEGSNPKIQRRFLTSKDKISCDFVVLRHVLEHMMNPYKFLQTLKSVFGSCPIYIEVPDFNWIIKTETFVDLTYEHVNYFTGKSLAKLFGDRVITTGNLFGGQYSYVVADINDLSPAFITSYEQDKNWSMIEFDSLFSSLSEKIRSIDTLSENKNIYIWGGATKGCMFVYHSFRINKLREKIRYVVDTNPAKCNKFLPGTSVQIKPPENLFRDIKKNDVLVIANPNYKDEISKDLLEHGIVDLRIVVL